MKTNGCDLEIINSELIIKPDFLEIVGMDKVEIYDLFLSSENEDDFIDKLELSKCFDVIDFNFKFSSKQEIEETIEEMKEEALEYASKCYKMCEKYYNRILV